MSATAAIEALSRDASFAEFVEYLQDSDSAGPVLSARRFSEALNMDLQTLAEQAGVHRNTLARTPGARGVQDFLREALRVIRAAADVSGNLAKALFWYRNEPLPVFEYKTAERLVIERRVDDLLRYLMSLEAGAAG